MILSRRILKRWAPWWVGAVLGPVFLATTLFASDGIGIITRLEGDVEARNQSGEPLPALAFMKVQEGDRFSLAAGSELQWVLFADGRRETWKGPATLIAGRTAGMASGSANQTVQPDVLKLQPKVSREVKRMSQLISMVSIQRAGTTLIRGESDPENAGALEPLPLSPEERAEIESAKETYQALSARSGPDDITPELYLFSVLADYDQFGEMAAVIRKMKEKQPRNGEIDALSQWLDLQM